MKQKFDMFLCVGVSDYNKGKFSVQPYNPDKGDIKYRNEAMVRPVEVEVDVPESIDVNSIKIRVLEEALFKDRADSEVRHNLLLDQISQLKCLGHDAEVV